MKRSAGIVALIAYVALASWATPVDGAVLLGDLDSDGDVDFADFLIFAGNYGMEMDPEDIPGLSSIEIDPRHGLKRGNTSEGHSFNGWLVSVSLRNQFGDFYGFTRDRTLDVSLDLIFSVSWEDSVRAASGDDSGWDPSGVSHLLTSDGQHLQVDATRDHTYFQFTLLDERVDALVSEVEATRQRPFRRSIHAAAKTLIVRLHTPSATYHATVSLN